MSTQTATRAFVREIAQDPAAAAQSLLAEDSAAAAALVQLLERKLSVEPLARLERVWQLSASGAAELFGVSRQAYAKWHANGVPAERRDDVRDLDEATQLLLDHVRADRIPAVVRRSAPLLGDRTLLDLGTSDGPSAVLDAVRSTFDLRRVQP